MLFRSRLLGIWHFICVQSRITRVLGYLDLKSSGIDLSTSSRLDQIFIVPKRRYIKLIQETKILLTVAWEMPNKTAKYASLNSCRNRHMTKKNHLLVSEFSFALVCFSDFPHRNDVPGPFCRSNSRCFVRFPLGLSIPVWPGMSASLKTQCKTK